MKNASSLIAVLAVCTALATPFEWRVNALETASRTFTAYHGETVELKPEFTLKGETLTNLTYSLCYQTNGMDSVWWMVPGTTFLPEMDCGANAYRFFIRAVGDGEVVYRANGILRMLPSPGWTPNEVKLPKPVIDFATVAATNAPWTTQAEVKKAIEEATPAQPESHQYLRTDLWTLGYEPVAKGSSTEEVVVTNIHGKIVEYATRTESTGVYAKMVPYYVSPFSHEVTLESVAVTDGAAETVADNPCVVRSTGDKAGSVTVEATTAGGVKRSVSFTMSPSSRSVTTSAKNYVRDGEGGAARGRINDLFNDLLRALKSFSSGEVVDRSHGEATKVYTSAYFLTDEGSMVGGISGAGFLFANCYRNTGEAMRPGYAGGRNTGNGGSFVIGRRLIANAAHWWGGHGAGVVRTLITGAGETMTVEQSGRQTDLAKWAVAKWGRDGFKDRFGFDVALISDIRIIEVNEDIPDQCVPALLPYAEAKTIFAPTGSADGNLDISCGGVTIGQNNSMYPVWIESCTGYGSARLLVANSTTVRADCLSNYKASPCFWTVRDGESGRPAFVFGNVPILVGAYHTLAGGASYICAADVIAELEREWGRDPDETLKRIKADDL